VAIPFLIVKYLFVVVHMSLFTEGKSVYNDGYWLMIWSWFAILSNRLCCTNKPPHKLTAVCARDQYNSRGLEMISGNVLLMLLGVFVVFYAIGYLRGYIRTRNKHQ